MTRQTFAKSLLRRFDVNQGVTSNPIVKKRESLRPPEARKTVKVKCSGEDVTIYVASGQLINNKKVCKRHMERKNK